MKRGNQLKAFEISEKCKAALDSKKGLDIEIIDTRKTSMLADYIVIATGTSNTHVKALADEVEFLLKESGIIPHHLEGRRSNSWLLIDYSNVIVNVFSQEARNFYNLEELLKND